ncbi:MAG: TrlF family AAA-like ATPase [Pirellulales bacterium]
MKSIGSVWRKWDLHIHTPASFQWSGGKKLHEQNTAEREHTCKSIIDSMNATDVAAFCVMDYWTFEGYILLRKYLDAHPDATSATVFPGIELRMEAPTDFRLNTHVLISDMVPIENLQHFLSTLRLGGPDGKPPSRQHLIEVAKKYDGGKMRKHGMSLDDRANDDKMYHLGVMTVEVTRESVEKAIEVLGKDNCLLIQPYGCSDGIERLDWEQHPYADHVLMGWADCFETRKQSQVELFLGIAQLEKQHIAEEFLQNIGGRPKPVFSGSDAHEYGTYGVYPSGRTTWLKAQPTFLGLRQVCHEPSQRCFIGERPPKMRHVEGNPTKYIRRVTLSKHDQAKLDEHWFDGNSIDLNPGLIAIIGNKGSGKSALADILALAGNSHCTKMEFLNKKRFCGTDNKAQHFSAAIQWASGEEVAVALSDSADTESPERVRYLPQHFIEELCNEIETGNEAAFGKELRKVIFSHVPEEDRLHSGTLDELLEYLVEGRNKAIEDARQALRQVNATITSNEREISAQTLQQYESALNLKRQELQALEELKPKEVDKPADDPSDAESLALITSIEEQQKQLALLQQQHDAATSERKEVVGRRATLARIIDHVTNFESVHRQFIEQRTEEFESAGFTITDIVTLKTDKEPLNKELDQAKDRLTTLTVQIEGEPAAEGRDAVPGLTQQITELQVAIAKLQDGLNAPQRAFQAYQKELEAWNAKKAAIVGKEDQAETIKFLEARISRIKDAIPVELESLRNERQELVRRIHTEMLAVRKCYSDMYAPVQKIATKAATSSHAIQLEFDASVAVSGFEDNFLDYIHKGRRGTFQGEEEGRAAVRSLLAAYDFNDTESTVAFTDAILEALTHLEKDSGSEAIPVSSQLRDKKKVVDLYDYVFGLGYLEVSYNLKLGGKDISQLSPGEKGALLLVFYLLLDTEEIPIIIDQPEHNLDNASVVRLLVECIRTAGARRQVFIVTHNPNLAVYCDADQIICCTIDKTDGHRIVYSCGAIEDDHVNGFAVDVLEGTYPAFDNRRRKWRKPKTEG